VERVLFWTEGNRTQIREEKDSSARKDGDLVEKGGGESGPQGGKLEGKTNPASPTGKREGGATRGPKD